MQSQLQSLSATTGSEMKSTHLSCVGLGAAPRGGPELTHGPAWQRRPECCQAHSAHEIAQGGKLEAGQEQASVQMCVGGMRESVLTM